MSDAIKMLASIMLEAQGTIDAETGEAIDVGYEVMQLKDEFNRLRAENEALRDEIQRYPDSDWKVLHDAAKLVVEIRDLQIKKLRGLLAEARYRIRHHPEITDGHRELLARIDAALEERQETEE